MTTPVQLIVFDLMGTLIVDDGLVEGAYSDALSQAGHPPGTDTHVDLLHRIGEGRGRPTLVVLSDVLGDPVAAEEASWAFDDSILAHLDALEPVPEAHAILDELRNRSILAAVTTSFSGEVRKAVLDRLGWSGTFAAELSAHGSRRGHPAPDLLLEAILELSIDSVAQVAIVGDTAADLEAGNRAGAGLVIGVLSGTHDRQRLEQAPHTHLIDSVADLPGVLDRPHTSGHRRASDS
ncbi:MAG: HAD family hydrolase [Acidimicrobiales bacterium]